MIITPSTPELKKNELIIMATMVLLLDLISEKDCCIQYQGRRWKNHNIRKPGLLPGQKWPQRLTLGPRSAGRQQFLLQPPKSKYKYPWPFI
jgi:hypothetical protein